MSNDVDQYKVFGGWLLVLLIGNWIGIVASVLLIIIGVIAISAVIALGGVSAAFGFISLAIWGGIAFLAFKFVTSLKKQSGDIPNSLVKLLLYIAGANIVSAVFTQISVAQFSITPIISSIIFSGAWFVLWAQYFQKSKRVQVYYGENANSYGF